MAESSGPDPKCPTNVLIGEVQLILAEKRTSLAVMRTGIAVLVLPLSVLGLLIATSRYYDMAEVLHLFVPLLVVCLGLLVFGSYLVTRSLKNIRHQERMILEIKKRHDEIRGVMD